MGGPEAQPSAPQSQTFQHTATCPETGEERTRSLGKAAVRILELGAVMQTAVVLRSSGIPEAQSFLDPTFPRHSTPLRYSTIPATKTSRK